MIYFSSIIFCVECVTHKLISGLWILNEIKQKQYPENIKKIVGAVWKLPAK
jgi:hypothetical protein